eukprot:CAMPEP_0197013132 /NCGR_PEP_ID=MMETSP1380-20130617/65176_1 /TAXON_ID=5936 /ORGANISM="Euplotes crassus, Strain CT5" /LENGTH=172 /DNA_ID=CAMNT_0042437151 /DNA_START=469 /DNA_END=984 /DNA_ORIENTATION=-
MQAEFKDEIIQFYAAQIALALDYIHSKGIIYLNVKMDNVMIGKDGYLKLIDFHKAKNLYKTGKTNTTIGNPTYTAPEILEGKIYDSSPDWWAFGILLYELHYGSPPFAGSDPFEVLKSIQKDEAKFSDENSDLDHLLSRLLRKDPKNRCKGQKVLQHMFFNNLDFKSLLAKK